MVRSVRLTERMRLWTNLLKEKDKVGNDDDDNDEVTICENPTDGDSEPTTNENDRVVIDRDVNGDVIELIEPIPPYELVYDLDEESSILADLMRVIQRGQVEKAMMGKERNKHLAQESMLEACLMTRWLEEDQTKQLGSSQRNLWHFYRSKNGRNKMKLNFNEKPNQLRIVVCFCYWPNFVIFWLLYVPIVLVN